LPTQILAVAGMIAAVLTGFPQVLLAAGKPRPLLYFNIALLLVYGGAVLATAERGIVAVAIAVVGVYVAQLVVVYAVLLRKVVGIRVSQMVGDLAPAVLGSLSLMAVCFPLTRLLRDIEAPAPLLLVAVGSLGLLIHCLVVRGLFPAVWHDLVALARRVLPARMTRGRAGAVAEPISVPQ
jgi:O-antigen/teichoic acid export membrane protein